jgi:hypothetical protein
MARKSSRSLPLSPHCRHHHAPNAIVGHPANVAVYTDLQREEVFSSAPGKQPQPILAGSLVRLQKPIANTIKDEPGRRYLGSIAPGPHG